MGGKESEKISLNLKNIEVLKGNYERAIQNVESGSEDNGENHTFCYYIGAHDWPKFGGYHKETLFASEISKPAKGNASEQERLQKVKESFKNYFDILLGAAEFYIKNGKDVDKLRTYLSGIEKVDEQRKEILEKIVLQEEVFISIKSR